MYIDTYIAIPLWIFAIFGMVYFLANVFDSLEALLGKRKGGYTLIISAREQEDSIEGIVEDFLLKAGINGGKGGLLDIVLVDWGFSDETANIMECLCQKHPFIRRVKPEDLGSYLKYGIYREAQNLTDN